MSIIALFILTIDKILNKYTKSLSENFINLKLIFWYLKFVDDYKNSIRLEHLPITFSKFDLNLNLQSFSLYLQVFQLNFMSFNETN